VKELKELKERKLTRMYGWNVLDKVRVFCAPLRPFLVVISFSVGRAAEER
jgi:hypothetical protein